jgi:methanogenic corrinoid protein MtbC1
MDRWVSAGYVETSVRLVQPALYEIGVLWERNEITVADEHRATAICETLLAQSFTGYPSYGSARRRALFAGVGGNRHLVGPRLVADAFALRGWRSEVMDSGATTEMLAARIDAARPDMVGLSVSLVTQFPALQRTVSVLRAEFGAQCPAIVVGGLSINQIDGLWQRIGCDAWGKSALDVERLAV